MENVVDIERIDDSGSGFTRNMDVPSKRGPAQMEIHAKFRGNKIDMDGSCDDEKESRDRVHYDDDSMDSVFNQEPKMDEDAFLTSEVARAGNNTPMTASEKSILLLLRSIIMKSEVPSNGFEDDTESPDIPNEHLGVCCQFSASGESGFSEPTHHSKEMMYISEVFEREGNMGEVCDSSFGEVNQIVEAPLKDDILHEATDTSTKCRPPLVHLDLTGDIESVSYDSGHCVDDVEDQLAEYVVRENTNSVENGSVETEEIPVGLSPELHNVDDCGGCSIPRKEYQPTNRFLIEDSVSDVVTGDNMKRTISQSLLQGLTIPSLEGRGTCTVETGRARVPNHLSEVFAQRKGYLGGSSDPNDSRENIHFVGVPVTGENKTWIDYDGSEEMIQHMDTHSDAEGLRLARNINSKDAIADMGGARDSANMSRDSGLCADDSAADHQYVDHVIIVENDSGEREFVKNDDFPVQHETQIPTGPYKQDKSCRPNQTGCQYANVQFDYASCQEIGPGDNTQLAFTEDPYLCHSPANNLSGNSRKKESETLSLQFLTVPSPSVNAPLSLGKEVIPANVPSLGPPCCDLERRTKQTIGVHVQPKDYTPLSCVVLFCCNPVFGLLALTLAVKSESAFSQGRMAVARRYSHASVAASIAGILVTTAITIIFLAVYWPDAEHNVGQ